MTDVNALVPEGESDEEIAPGRSAQSLPGKEDRASRSYAYIAGGGLFLAFMLYVVWGLFGSSFTAIFVQPAVMLATLSAGTFFGLWIQARRVTEAMDRAASSAVVAQRNQNEASMGRALAAVLQAEEQSPSSDGSDEVVRRHAEMSRALLGQLVSPVKGTTEFARRTTSS